ncbi:MAG TPA: hypothetical protein VHY19_02200 [Steroidobacteraceae bacterium]|jgi:hypothetical protein|nr:hypothetical protein [Steroidobacteraceae bacterium]
MRLSEFHALIQAAGDVESYALWLAAPDKDGIDVDLAAVGRVDVQFEAAEVRLYPASTKTDTDSIEPEPAFGIMLSQLPGQVSLDEDFRMLVEIPLLRDDVATDSPSFAELQAVHIATDSREVWLLARPASEFADGLLPD